jgi:hypothetical protein
MAQQPESEIAQSALSQGLIAGRPVGDGGNGGGGGCMPGTVIKDLSLVMNPNTLFVTVNTPVQLTGRATVRRWLPDCSTRDADSPVQWSLFYQSINSGASIDVTSILVDGPGPGTAQFSAGLPGIYDVVLVCPQVAAATSARLLVGRGAVIDGTATAWVNNDLPIVGGCGRFPRVGGNPIPFHAVIITLPQGTQSAVIFDPIRLPNAVITQTSPGTGSFDLSAGTIEAQINAAVQARANGTVSMTLSTSGTIVACDNTSVSGSAISGGQAVLVGDAPVDGPPGTTHSWLAVNANVTPVGF